MSSTSGRAFTSIPVSEDNTPGTSSDLSGADGAEDARAALLEDVFVPHVFDFISMARNAGDRLHSIIPPLFLEPLAVDQSTLVGDGASFSAFRKPLPRLPTKSEPQSLDGLIISTSLPIRILPKYVVYKVARVAFTEAGQPTPETRQAMKAAMMELFALVHPPLLKHTNIVDFFGLAWGSNYYEPSHRMPVLVVEYAEHGNLAQLQGREDLEPSMRSSLALDVGAGIQVLHRCGIIHGDVKSENVLIFSHQEKKYLAKVADFGFSLVGQATEPGVYIGGTKPWKAPEAKTRLAKEALKATDVYSYGLLLWRLATDGKNPFRFLVSSEMKGDDYMNLLEVYKSSNGPAKNTELENWFLPYIISEQTESPGKPSTEQLSQMMSNLRLLLNTIQTDSNTLKPQECMYSILKEVLRCSIATSGSTELIGQMFLKWAHKDPFYGNIAKALSRCLSALPLERDFEAALAVLKGETWTESKETTVLSSNEDGNTLLKTSYDHHLLSWQQMQYIEPSVQSFIFQRFLSKTQRDFSLDCINPPDCFVLASYYISAYGTKLDFKEATRLLLKSSQQRFKHWPSRAYTYRICKALDFEFKPDEDLISGLYDSAMAGSRTALADLEEVDEARYRSAKNIVHDCFAGVGASFFFEDNMLAGATYWRWSKTFDNLEVLVQNLGRLNWIAEYKVNKRGDGILHMAAASGKHLAIKTLLSSFKALNINQINDQGETPLLCACRAGHVETVYEILNHAADASISTPMGESCLHWLISFGDTHVQEIAKGLLKAGANVRMCTRTRIAYSVFPSGIDVDREYPSTPLVWAVHNNRPRIVEVLLEETQDASIILGSLEDDPRCPPPLQLAACWHNIECLQLLVEAMNKAKMTFNYGPLLEKVIYGADPLSMILRSGPKYKDKLFRTLDFLIDHSKKIQMSFLNEEGDFRLSLLYKAITGAHDQVVEHLLSPRVEELLGPFDVKSDLSSYLGAFHPSDINRPCGSEQRTPLLESVRWNRIHMVEFLLQHGADPKAEARHPFAKYQINWTALHILANAGHNTDVSLASLLVRSGLNIDGHVEEASENSLLEPSNQQDETTVSSRHDLAETPLLVAVQNNAFNLATEFLNLGADINALSLGSGFIALEHQTTVLGHLIAASSQHTVPRIRYLLQISNKHDEVDFVVEPARNLSALHRVSWANKAVYHRSPEEPGDENISRDEYDMDVNRDILIEILQKWNDAEYLNRRSGLDDKTALHLAVEAGNVEAVRLLLDWGADRELEDANGHNSLGYAVSLVYMDEVVLSGIKQELDSIISLLSE